MINSNMHKYSQSITKIQNFKDMFDMFTRYQHDEPGVVVWEAIWYETLNLCPNFQSPPYM